MTEYLQRCLSYDNVIVIVFSGAAVPKGGSSGQAFASKAEERLRSHEPAIMSLLRALWVASEAPPAVTRRPMSITDSLIAAMRTHHNVPLSKRQAEVALRRSCSLMMPTLERATSQVPERKAP